MEKCYKDNEGTMTWNLWRRVQGEGTVNTLTRTMANWAELDVDKDGVWTLYEKANGKAKADALRAKFRAAVSNDWSYLYTLNEELSSN